MCRLKPLVIAMLLVGLAAPALAGGDGFWPGKRRWWAAIKEAARDRDTWVPAAGAAALIVSGYDDDIADWAVRKTPVFGSPESAREASDRLRNATHLGFTATALFAPGSGPWGHRFEVAGMQHVAAAASSSSAGLFKDLVGRDRPDGSSDQSFPSGHASRAFAYAALARDNLAGSDLPRGWARGLGIGMTTLAAGTAWARVEGGRHYPSDVLAGAALGNFVSRVLNEAFFAERPNFRLDVGMEPGGASVAVAWQF